MSLKCEKQSFKTQNRFLKGSLDIRVSSVCSKKKKHFTKKEKEGSSKVPWIDKGSAKVLIFLIDLCLEQLKDFFSMQSYLKKKWMDKDTKLHKQIIA